VEEEILGTSPSNAEIPATTEVTVTEALPVGIMTKVRVHGTKPKGEGLITKNLTEGVVQVRRSGFRRIRQGVLGKDRRIHLKITEILSADEIAELKKQAEMAKAPDYRKKEKITEEWNLMRHLCNASSKKACEDGFKDPLLFKVFVGVFDTLLELGPKRKDPAKINKKKPAKRPKR